MSIYLLIPLPDLFNEIYMYIIIEIITKLYFEFLQHIYSNIQNIGSNGIR